MAMKYYISESGSTVRTEQPISDTRYVEVSKTNYDAFIAKQQSFAQAQEKKMMRDREKGRRPPRVEQPKARPGGRGIVNLDQLTTRRRAQVQQKTAPPQSFTQQQTTTFTPLAGEDVRRPEVIPATRTPISRSAEFVGPPTREQFQQKTAFVGPLDTRRKEKTFFEKTVDYVSKREAKVQKRQEQYSEFVETVTKPVSGVPVVGKVAKVGTTIATGWVPLLDEVRLGFEKEFALDVAPKELKQQVKAERKRAGDLAEQRIVQAAGEPETYITAGFFAAGSLGGKGKASTTTSKSGQFKSAPPKPTTGLGKAPKASTVPKGYTAGRYIKPVKVKGKVSVVDTVSGKRVVLTKQQFLRTSDPGLRTVAPKPKPTRPVKPVDTPKVTRPIVVRPQKTTSVTVKPTVPVKPLYPTKVRTQSIKTRSIVKIKTPKRQTGTQLIKTPKRSIVKRPTYPIRKTSPKSLVPKRPTQIKPYKTRPPMKVRKTDIVPYKPPKPPAIQPTKSILPRKPTQPVPTKPKPLVPRKPQPIQKISKPKQPKRPVKPKPKPVKPRVPGAFLGGLPKVDLGGGGGGYNPSWSFGKKRKKTRKKYTPSLIARTFQIYGDKPTGQLTGLEFRPLVGKKKKKSKGDEEKWLKRVTGI